MIGGNLAIGLTCLLAAFKALGETTCINITITSDSTCDSIATAVGIKISQLAEYNPKANCSSLEIGKELCVANSKPLEPKLDSKFNGTCSTNKDNNCNPQFTAPDVKANVTDDNAAQKTGQDQKSEIVVNNFKTDSDLATPKSLGTWKEIKGGDCRAFGVRNYTARLYDIPSSTEWDVACRKSPITIPGVVANKLPDVCENAGLFSGEVGTFYVASNETYCRPNWGAITKSECVDNHKRHYYARLQNIPSGTEWMPMCLTAPVEIAGTKFNKPDSCDDKGIRGIWGNWMVPDVVCGGYWDTLSDNGCSTEQKGKREWSAKLLSITNDWAEACKTHEATVKDEYFKVPSRCDQNITGIWGIFYTMDPICGIPPCPNRMAWDFNSNACQPCNNLGKRSPISAALDSAIEDSLIQRSSRSFNLKTKRQTLHISHLEKQVGECSAFHRPDGTVVYMPNNRLAWVNDNGTGGEQAEGPTAAAIASNPDVLREFQAAWDDSFPTTNTAQEIGGWIYADPANPRRLFIRRAQRNRSNVMHRNRTPEVAAGIDLNNPESNPGRPADAGWVIVANFHTHPMGAAYGGNPQTPSRADNVNAWFRGVPGIIIHNNGLTGYGPRARAMLDAPRGYPNSNEEFNGQGADGDKLGKWTPKKAPNQ